MTADELIVQLDRAGIQLEPWQRRVLELASDPDARMKVSIKLRHKRLIGDPSLSRLLGDPRETVIERFTVRGDSPHAVFIDEC